MTSPRKKSAAKRGAPLFDRVVIVGLGLIGSSLARAIKKERIARTLVACDADTGVRAKVNELSLADAVEPDVAKAVAGADLVVVCTPVSTYAALGAAIGPKLKRGAILSDVGSVKQVAVDELGRHLRKGVHLVPGHPVAGTEHSGPEAGFADLVRRPLVHPDAARGRLAGGGRPRSRRCGSASACAS